MRHECDFAELAGAFVGGDELVERLFAGGCGGFDDLAVLEGAADVFDQRALMGKRLRCRDVAVDAVFVRVVKHSSVGILGWQ